MRMKTLREFIQESTIKGSMERKCGRNTEFVVFTPYPYGCDLEDIYQYLKGVETEDESIKELNPYESYISDNANIWVRLEKFNDWVIYPNLYGSKDEWNKAVWVLINTDAHSIAPITLSDHKYMDEDLNSQLGTMKLGQVYDTDDGINLYVKIVGK